MGFVVVQIKIKTKVNYGQISFKGVSFKGNKAKKVIHVDVAKINNTKTMTAVRSF